MSLSTIRCDPADAARERYDLIVVGGGVYGIMTALEATRRGLRPILLERSEFAEATSANSLRILHGGLRYLQSLDLRRSLESIEERAWWLRNFPDHTQPLPCLMPLYGDGLRRPPALRVALALNDMLCRIKGGDLLPPGQVIGAEQVRAISADIDTNGLKGGALWYDAFAPDMPKLVLEVLHRACSQGAIALNQVEAHGLLVENGSSVGVRARDLSNDAELVFNAPVVINAAGPSAPDFAAACGARESDLFVPTLAWNVVFGRPPRTDHALAVRPRRKDGQTFFLVPWQGKLLAGTGHAAWNKGHEKPEVPNELVCSYVKELNAALPELKLADDDVVHVFSGLLPGRRPGSAELADRPVVLEHGKSGGPGRLFTVIGIKLTTARAVAARVLGLAFPSASTQERTPTHPGPVGDASTMSAAGGDSHQGGRAQSSRPPI